MVKRMAVVSFLALLAGVNAAQSQTFEALRNPNVVAGASYRLEDPLSGSRTQFLLSANIAGMKLGSAPVYVGGVGIDIRTLDAAFDQFSGLSWTVPFITYFPKGDKIVLQVGYSRDLVGEEKSDGIFVGVGFSWNSPNEIAAKRAAKKAAQGKP